MTKRIKKTATSANSPKTDDMSDNGRSLLRRQHKESAGILRDQLGRFLSGTGNGWLKHYQDVEQLRVDVMDYFERCELESKPVSMSGLALSIGMTRQGLLKYAKEQGYEEFYSTIQYARQLVEQWTEEQLHNPKGMVVGAIFSLKNNFGWEDKQNIKMDSRSVSLTGFSMLNNNDEHGSEDQSDR